MSEYIFV